MAGQCATILARTRQEVLMDPLKNAEIFRAGSAGRPIGVSGAPDIDV
jgi:hypothetical protein